MKNLVIINMIDQIILHCNNWISTDGQDNKIIIDPVDEKVIGAHYALSHFGVALCLYGNQQHDSYCEQIGKEIIEAVLKRWKNDTQIYDFHWDFNSFALCVLVQYWEDNQINLDSPIYDQIKSTVINAKDSRHDTINWIPMRIFVNKKRADWTKNLVYQDKINKLKRKIEAATNADGYIEDRLPKGTSYNLQYNVATTSLLVLLNKHGFDFGLAKRVSALIRATDPEGDINYLGRGCNQAFAWGPWLYLLNSTGQVVEFDKAVDYLSKHFETMLNNNNILLNSYPGKEKYMWWDYHYSSVYLAHLLFWLVLTYCDQQIASIPVEKCESSIEDTGIRISSSDKFFIVNFKGRKEYLAEKGPNVVNLWVKKYGTMYKGSFGPWLGSFGNKYPSNLATLLNYLGPIVVKRKHNGSQYNHYFPEISVEANESELIIKYAFKKQQFAMFNFPMFLSIDNLSRNFRLYADEQTVELVYCGSIKNQYNELKVCQSKTIRAREWKLHINI